MAIDGVIQPEIIVIDRYLRLKKYSDDCEFALCWYQDEETLLLVDGKNEPYDLDRLYGMYHYLEVSEIYDYNIGSQRLFQGVGFQISEATKRRHSYRLLLDT